MMWYELGSDALRENSSYLFYKNWRGDRLELRLLSDVLWLDPGVDSVVV